MAELRRPFRSALATLASTAMLIGLSAAWAPPAHADVIVAVRGEACGYVTNVGLFGGAQAKLGCEPQAGQPYAPANDSSRSPSVALPADGSGSSTPITASDPDGAAAKYGPATIFGGRWPPAVNTAPPSGPISVSTQGTPASATVTSSAEISLYPTPQKVQCYGDPAGSANCDAPGGFGPFPVEGDSVRVECSASASGVSGSTTLSNAVLATSTDADGIPKDTEAVPDHPPVNYTRGGIITNVGDVFSVVYNEQIVNRDGSLTVNGAHMYLFGPTAIGEIIKGQVTCGTTPSAVSPSDTRPPTCGIPLVEQNGPSDSTPRSPRTELVGVFDAGGLRSIDNLQVANGTGQVGEPTSQQAYMRFTPGQTGPLKVTATADPQAEAAGEGMYWSYDATDTAGNTAHCQGAKHPPVAADDAYQTTENSQLVVPPPGVLANDSLGPDGGILTAKSPSSPLHGTLQVSPDGAFVYSPDQGFFGTDSFTYEAYDGYSGVRATVTITVTPANQAPLALADAYTTSQGKPLTVAAPGVLANDVDVDGDPLTASPAGGPAHGSVALHADGSFVYTPDAAYSGLDTFTYTVSDGKGGSATGTVAITVTPKVSVSSPVTARACASGSVAVNQTKVSPDPVCVSA